MTETPRGIVTLLFTDQVASTELRERLGDDEAESLRRTHFRLLRRDVADLGGQEVKSMGDGLMVVFASTVDALACAVAMQQAVHRHNQQQDENHRLHVRVGLHVGEPIREEEDYFGMPVNIAKRLCDSAQGGQIVASELVRGLVGSRGGYTFRSLGQIQLKGITEPLPICEVAWEPAAEEPAVSHQAVDEETGPLPLPPLLATSERTTFVGRQPELEALRRYWDRAQRRQRQLVFVAGEPGMGKTRLAAEFALAVHAEGATVLFGRCDAEALVPYQPFVEALRHYVADWPAGELRRRLGPGGSELAKLVTGLSDGPSEPSDSAAAEPESDRYRLFEAVTSLLVEASRAAPLLVLLDDLQWADKPTLQLLKHVVRSLEASSDAQMLILGTYREAELDRVHPLSELLADLRRGRVFERVSLPGLEEDNVAELISSRAGHGAPPDFVRAVTEQTEGNPFFIEEVLRHLAETDAIFQRGGRLATNLTTAQLNIPESIRDVIGQRLSRLSEECNSVLTIASVIDREFGLDALERASDLSSARLLELLEEAIAACVVSEVPQMVGRYRFSHSLIYETLYDELTTTRRVHLHGQTLQYADSNGVKLAYEVLGASGPYLIVVGLSNCPAVRARNLTFARRWERISGRCRVILYDRRGVGFSAAPERGYSLFASVEDLRAVLDAVGAERVVLWGATDGGPLAIAFAAQYPERVAGLLLMGTTAKFASSPEYSFGVSPAVIEAFLRTDAVDQGTAIAQVTRTRPYRPEEADAIGEVMRRVPRQAWSKLLGGIVVADARSLLERVLVPAFIVHDPDNAYIPAEAASYLHEHLPNSQLEITEDYGPPLFGEALYTKIETFIERATGSGALD